MSRDAYDAPLKTVSLCGVTFSVGMFEGKPAVVCWEAEHPHKLLGHATIPCAKGRAKALLRVIDYGNITKESVS